MQRSSANQSECSEQTDPEGGSSIQENNQQANREDTPRESKAYGLLARILKSL